MSDYTILKDVYDKDGDYEYKVFTIPESSIEFSLTENGLFSKDYPCRLYVSSIHPYDLTDYHYAISDDHTYWKIYLNGKWVAGPFYSPVPYRIAKKLLEFDKAAGLRANIDHT